MIIVTGGAGFIGSAIVWELNSRGFSDVLIVDELGTSMKWKNLVPLHYMDFINKHVFIERILEKSFDASSIEAIIHMGANSSTTETDADHLMENNFHYTMHLADYCVRNKIRFIYASSAATYGDGSLGFSDSNEICLNLRPLNMYGYSKNLFDQYALRNGYLNNIAGLKYFNVYGPNETHKDDMRSVVNKAFGQIKETGKVQLFRSLHPDYKDGEQKRDFIYVKDAVAMTLHFLHRPEKNGLYNIGSSMAATWLEVVNALFDAMGLPPNIEFIDMPEHLAAKYQYFTEADIAKLRSTGYTAEITPLPEAISDYVRNYLIPGKSLE